MIVDCWVNNHPLKVIFDTGASAHFGMNQLREAGVDLPRGNASAVTHGWAGKAVPVWQMYAKLRIGNMTRTVPITVEENMDLLPLVGQEFARDLQYSIEDRANTMILSKRQSTATSEVNPLYDIPCSHGAQNDFVPLSVNGRTLQVFIDTGSSNTIFSTSAVQQLGLEIPADGIKMTMTGVGGQVIMTQMYLDLQLGPIRRSGFPVLVGGSAGSCVGQDFLAGYRFTADREKNLLRFFH